MCCMHRFLRFRMGCHKLPRDMPSGLLTSCAKTKQNLYKCQQGV